MQAGTTSNALCLDTSYLVGLFDQSDLWHTRSREIYLLLRQHQIRVYYFDCVLNELFTVLARRCREKARADLLSDLVSQVTRAIPSDEITWVYPYLPVWYNRCLDIFSLTQGQLNFHDSLIVVATQELSISTLVSFDSGFDAVASLNRLGDAEEVKSWLESESLPS